MRSRPSNLLSKAGCGADGRGWNALAEIGRQLQILARAQSGEGDFFARAGSPTMDASPLSVLEISTADVEAWLQKLRVGARRKEGYLGDVRMLEFQRALLATGLEWPQNVARHSFCSYHLARFKSASETALEAGHSEAMLFQNYRSLLTPCGKLVTPDLAAEYWGIVPLTDDQWRLPISSIGF
ncbi:MAG: hypothetical protein ACREE6_09250 [Limisphaerales bacterium]